MKLPQPSQPKRPRGRPIVRAIKINAIPEQLAQAMFKAALKPKKPKP